MRLSMLKTTLPLFLAGLMLSVSCACAAPIDSVVKIYTVVSPPSYVTPWVDEFSGEVTGTGCVIKGKRLLTNAHVVSDQTVVMVRKQSSPNKYRARVSAIAHECDLALLTVDDESFFTDLTPLEIMPDLPELQEQVSVVGYPEGGDTISYSQGVVSRIEVERYTHSDLPLLTMQIDAAINPGNSGGPVIRDGKLAGVVMQYLQQAQNIGYAAPGPIIHRFLKDVETNGKFAGFGRINVLLQRMENQALRDSKQMKADQSGVLVIGVPPATTNIQHLQIGDVLMAVDGVKIANNGTTPLRKGERVDFSYAYSHKLIGEPCTLSILRAGVPLEVVVPLMHDVRAIPKWQYDVAPSYLVYGGIVFMPLTLNYMAAYGDGPKWPRTLLVEFDNHVTQRMDEQVVVLHQILADDCNIGYGENERELIVRKVNGQPIVNLKDLWGKIQANTNRFISIESDRSSIVVLDAAQAKAATERVLKNYRIPAAMSADLMR